MKKIVLVRDLKKMLDRIPDHYAVMVRNLDSHDWSYELKDGLRFEDVIFIENLRSQKPSNKSDDQVGLGLCK